MGVLLVIIGLIILAYAGWLFLKFFWMCFKLLLLPFQSEKQLDKQLFKSWKKEKDYEKFEKEVEKL